MKAHQTHTLKTISHVIAIGVLCWLTLFTDATKVIHAQTYRLPVKSDSTAAKALYDIYAQSNLRLYVSASRTTIHPGEMVTITAALLNITTTLTGNVIISGSIQAAHPRFNQRLVFNDAGVNGDAKAKDGLFTAQFTTPANTTFPDYAVFIEARQGKTQLRDMLNIGVVPDTLHFEGPITSGVYDDDGDGLYNSLVITVPVSMTKRGRAGVQAFLFDAAGKYIESPYNLETLDAQLGPGTVPVRIYFNGQNIRKHGADGPYTIQLIILTDPSVSMLEVDSMRNAHTTAAYRHTQFEDSPLVFGAGSDALVDANKDGIAEALVITLSVAGANPGIYRWSADLMTITGTHVAAIFGQSALDAGTVTLRFDGTQIRTSGMPGPYVVASFNVSQIKGIGSVNAKEQDFWDLYRTHVYSLAQFQTRSQ